MDRFYRGFETGLLGLSFCLGLAAFAVLASPPRESGSLAVTLPMLSVTAGPFRNRCVRAYEVARTGLPCGAVGGSAPALRPRTM